MIKCEMHATTEIESVGVEGVIAIVSIFSPIQIVEINFRQKRMKKQ